MTLNEFLENHREDYIVIDYDMWQEKGFGKNLMGKYNDLYVVTDIDNQCDYCDYLITVA